MELMAAEVPKPISTHLFGLGRLATGDIWTTCAHQGEAFAGEQATAPRRSTRYKRHFVHKNCHLRNRYKRKQLLF